MKKYGRWILGLLLVVLIVEVVIVAPGTINESRKEEEQEITNDLGNDVQQAMKGAHVVETNNGVKEWELWADEALDFQSEQMWLNNVKAIFTGRDGVLFTVTGEEGFVDPNSRDMKVQGNVITRSSNGYIFKSDTVKYASAKKKLSSPGLVRVTGPKDKHGDSLKMNGVGMEADLNGSLVDILSNVKATKAVKDGKIAKIQSDTAVLSGLKRMASFHGNVVIDMDDMRITGPDAEFVYNKANNAVDSMFIKNGVKVSDALKYATSDNVRVLFQEEKFVFRGSPRVVQNNDELTGEEIVFLDGGDRVKVQKVRARVEEETVQQRQIQ